MKLNMEVVHLRENSKEVIDITSPIEFSQTARFTLIRESRDMLINHLTPFFHAKLIDPSQLVGRNLRRYGVGESGEGRNYTEEALVGPAYIYKIKSATVMPSMNFVIKDDRVIGDLFGVDNEDYRGFILRYGDYFGFSKNGMTVSINPLESKWTFFSNPVTSLEQMSYTPILLSNNIHDYTFAHWHAIGIYKLFLLQEHLRKIANPLLIFTYKPKNWQLEIIKFLFPSLGAAWTTVERPIKLENLIIIAHKHSAFFDSQFLLYLYNRSKFKVQSSYPSKIYISRNGATSRKIVNQREINPVLIKSGFTILNLYEYPFEAQVALVSSANKIIYIAGSDVTMTIYAQPFCKIGVISHLSAQEGSVEFCANFGHPHVKILTGSVVGTDSEFDLQVDFEEFRNFVENF